MAKPVAAVVVTVCCPHFQDFSQGMKESFKRKISTSTGTFCISLPNPHHVFGGESKESIEGLICN